MWDFNIENQGKDEEALNVDRERQELEDNSEYNTRFGDKISEVTYAHQDLRYSDRNK
jgi:hypothetical protein